MTKINALAKQRKEETLAEEEEELRAELQNQMTDWLNPEIQERIYTMLMELLNETENAEATDVLMDILEDEIYIGSLFPELCVDAISPAISFFIIKSVECFS